MPIFFVDGWELIDTSISYVFFLYGSIFVKKVIDMPLWQVIL